MQEALQHPSLARLFWAFLRLGATAFGGPAMAAYIRQMAVNRYHWLDDRTFREGLALCQALPGATAMQIAGYVGLRVDGIRGAVVVFIAFGLPSFVLMVVLSVFYIQAHDLPLVAAAFTGLKAVIVAIVALAAIEFGRHSISGWREVFLMIVAAVAFWAGLNPIFVVVIAAVLGILLFRETRFIPCESPAPAQAYPWRPILLIIVATAIGLAVVYGLSPLLATLATIMLRVSLFAFGGGFGALPLMYDAVVQSGQLMASQTFLDGVALGQITPGPIVITATFIGYLLAGIGGALVATLSVFLPSFLVLVGVDPIYGRLRGRWYFNAAVNAVAVSFVGLLLSMVVRFSLEVTWDVPHILLAGLAFLALFKIDVIWVVIAATVASVVLFGAF